MKFELSMCGTLGLMVFWGRGRGVIGSRKEAKTPRKPVTVVLCRVVSRRGMGWEKSWTSRTNPTSQICFDFEYTRLLAVGLMLP